MWELFHISVFARGITAERERGEHALISFSIICGDMLEDLFIVYGLRVSSEERRDKILTPMPHGRYKCCVVGIHSWWNWHLPKASHVNLREIHPPLRVRRCSPDQCGPGLFPRISVRNRRTFGVDGRVWSLFPRTQPLVGLDWSRLDKEPFERLCPVYCHWK